MSNRKNKNSKKKGDKKSKNQLKEYAKYSSLGFQMLAIILAGVLGGMKLDEVVGSIEFPLFTLLLSILGVALSIYYAIKDFIKNK